MPTPANIDSFLDLLAENLNMTKPAALEGELINAFMPWGVLKKRVGVLISSLYDKSEDVVDVTKTILTEMGCSTNNALTVNKIKKFCDVTKTDEFKDKLNAALRILKQEEKGGELGFNGDAIRLEGLFDTVYMQFNHLKTQERNRHDEKVEELRKKKAEADALFERKIKKLKDEYAVVASYEKLDDTALAARSWGCRYDGAPASDVPAKSQATIDDAIRTHGSTASRKHKLSYVATAAQRDSLIERGKDIVELLKSDFRIKRARRVRADLEALGIDVSDIAIDEAIDDEDEGEDDIEG